MSWYQSDLQQSESAYIPPTWADGTDEEIIEALTKHYNDEIDLTEYWAVGDERVVSLSAMEATGVGESHAAQSVTLVLSNVGGKYLADGVTECAFQVDQKDVLNEKGYMNDSYTNYGGWKNSARRTWCNSVYKNAIPSTLRGIFKEFINQSGKGYSSTSGVENTTDYFALRAEVELTGSYSESVSGEGSQVNWYETTSNRIKHKQWWLRSPKSGFNDSFCAALEDGSTYYYFASFTYGIAPFGVI